MQAIKQIITSKLLNLVIFNLLWLGLVLGRDSLIQLTFAVLIVYLICLVIIGKLKIYQLVLPASIGVTIDCTLTFFGLFNFPDSSFIVPLWLIVLWFNFSTTLTLSLSFINRSKLLASGLGAAALPFNYAVGERLGAVTFGEPYFVTILVLALVWSVSFPALFIVSNAKFTKKISMR